MRPLRALTLAGLAASSLASCSLTASEELSSLAEKPPLPYSVLISGGGFVDPSSTLSASGPLGRTYVLPDPLAEAFALEDLARSLRLGKVFVAIATDTTESRPRQSVAFIDEDVAAQDNSLEEILVRARLAGHDFVLVVERIHDGPVESRGVNDRWPFTVAAWLFALGALIPDRTYESLARLKVSVRDVYTGERVSDQIVVEPGPVDLNMFERCGLWGFVQSILIPPFWTSTKPESIVESVRESSTDRILVSAVRRLKSAQTRGRLERHGPARIEVADTGDALQIKVIAKEMLSGVDLTLDGVAIDARVLRSFQRELLRSESQPGDGGDFFYSASLPIPDPGRLQILVQTKASRLRSVTHVVEAR